MVLVGYVTAKDMDGLTKYYKSLFNDCNNINNLAAINPEAINNPSIYAILADKYNKAISKNIQLELGVFIDLNSLHIDTYELTRILGILLDNSIEAAQECGKKYISVRFLMDYRMNRQLDYLIFVKTFFINLLYYFFVWQTSENDIFFKKLYLFHFFYDKIQL